MSVSLRMYLSKDERKIGSWFDRLTTSVYGNIVLTTLALAAHVCAQEWRDPSPHRSQFVTVDEGVQLEVLDWGGPGRPIVLLAGSGNSAHVFDDFAPKLTDAFHVYGFTRRGYGASSQPASGYDNQRLADDVFAVLEALKIDRPVLAGHSMAGGELTTLGNQHSDHLAGLVYLDALGDPRDFPPGDSAYQPKNAEERAAIEAYSNATAAYVERWVKNLRSGVPGARIVDLPGAGHFVFLTRGADVLREVRAFVTALE